MIGIVAHDAGGAEILASYIRQNGLACACCLEGAARDVFARKLGAVENLSLEALIGTCDWLLCGTSFLSDLEWRAMRLAKRAGKRTVAALDHWVNYRQRFLRHGEWCFPDEIWVGDDIALSLACEELPEIKLTLVPNPYFRDLRDEMEDIVPPPREADGAHVLYVCEPLRDDGLALYGDERYWGYTEEEALRYFLANAKCLADRIGRIVVRRHPQEHRGKYDWAAAEFDLPIVTDEDKTLLEQVVASDVVVGGATMAMVVGLIAGKRVVCCVPPGGRFIPLPQPEIEDMGHLLAAPEGRR